MVMMMKTYELLRGMLLKFLRVCDRAIGEPKYHGDAFIEWLDKIIKKMISNEKDSGVISEYSSIRKIALNVLTQDEDHRERMIYFMHLIRNAPSLELRPVEIEFIKQHYGADVRAL